MKPRILDLAREGFGVDDIRVRTGHAWHVIARTLEIAGPDVAPLARLARKRATEHAPCQP